MHYTGLFMIRPHEILDSHLFSIASAANDQIELHRSTEELKYFNLTMKLMESLQFELTAPAN